MNITFLIGNLTREPEEIKTENKTLCKLNIAVNANYTNADGERPVQFFNIAVWDKMAENCIKFLHKGNKISVVGRLQIRQYEDKDKVKKQTIEVVAQEIEYLSTKAKEEPKEEMQLEPIDDQNLPF